MDKAIDQERRSISSIRHESTASTLLQRPSAPQLLSNQVSSSSLARLVKEVEDIKTMIKV